MYNSTKFEAVFFAYLQKLFPCVRCAYKNLQTTLFYFFAALLVYKDYLLRNPQTKFGADTFICKRDWSHFHIHKLGVSWPPSLDKPNTQMLEMVQNRANPFISNLEERNGLTREKAQFKKKRRMQKMKTLLNVMESRDFFFLQKYIFLLTCVLKRIVNTRVEVKGLYFAIALNRDAFLKFYTKYHSRS